MTAGDISVPGALPAVIGVRGARHNNLRDIDVNVPLWRTVAVVGGAGRLLLGTDFPYEAGDVFVRAIDYITDPHITQDEANAILEGNATALFGITTPAGGATS